MSRESDKELLVAYENWCLSENYAGRRHAGFMGAIDAFLISRDPGPYEWHDLSNVPIYAAPMDDVSDCSCPVYAAPFEEGGELSDVPCALPTDVTVPGRAK